MQQIADWLEKLGMSEYAQRFAENDIDFARPSRPHRSRPQRDWGVLLGHRRKLLRAIAELNDGRERSAEGRPSGCRTRCAARYRRAPSSHGDVLGPCRLDGALGAHGP